jgi:hypothetical protein
LLSAVKTGEKEGEGLEKSWGLGYIEGVDQFIVGASRVVPCEAYIAG